MGSDRQGKSRLGAEHGLEVEARGERGLRAEGASGGGEGAKGR